MLGVNKGQVVLTPHAKEWNQLFNDEKKLLEDLIGNHAEAIEHIGSTAIAAICAKPIIDILVGVESMEEVKHFDRERLKESGYYHLAKVQIEGKEVFAKFSDLEAATKTHILHVVEYEGEWWQQHTFFRDYLNDNLALASEYETLKNTLAAQYANDERSYTAEKKQFVDYILSKR
ncbi:GrpB family protein [Salsuginibacillus kocurii]|uniref:GrpB family protein n=1 Tax=Salsuginibacillus kocurii TaxID=427078 RepID=UPI00036EE169|nr:GrpB family protein [Salsuginibacillus kocurii]